ncbi:hypothetical protein pmac_cds_663 [Pandoravirus macleodensis]|uniref:Uncharacterized protein n=1 Tax=Pandoravirus macleodensis TaxID=2107707 RepID=A0A2U7UH82_9VIRU|nr:hypothetical protein pmac_cds_663 [Pandoravirus macleodensis]AVK77351.1 hypothetical protein pmac_cds_663 [Pandoravirus macleodensis]
MEDAMPLGDRGGEALSLLPARGRLVDYVQDLVGVCSRIAAGRGTHGDDAALSRLLRGSPIDGVPDHGADASDGVGLVARYARLWRALDADPDALDAVRAHTGAWPPAVSDVALTYVRVNPSETAMRVVHALARDEAMATARLAEASAPERIVALLGAAARRGALATRATAAGIDGAFFSQRLGDLYDPQPATGAHDHDASDRMYVDRMYGVSRFSPPTALAQYAYRAPLVSGPSRTPSASPPLPMASSTVPMPTVVRAPTAEWRIVAPARGVAYMPDAIAPEHDSAPCGSQDNAWWARACHMPGQD